MASPPAQPLTIQPARPTQPSLPTIEPTNPPSPPRHHPSRPFNYSHLVPAEYALLPEYQSVVDFRAAHRLEDLKKYHCKKGDIRVAPSDPNGITLKVEYGQRVYHTSTTQWTESTRQVEVRGEKVLWQPDNSQIETYRIATHSTNGCFRCLLEAKNDMDIYFLGYDCAPDRLIINGFKDGDTMYVEREEWRIYG